MGDIGSASFDRINDAIPLGRAAALTHRAELERYSVPESEYLAWREARSLPGREKVTLAGVELHGVERVNPDFVRQHAGPGARRRRRCAPDRGACQCRVRAVRLRSRRLPADGRPEPADPGPARAGEVPRAARPAVRPRPAHRHGRKHRVHARRRLPADLGQRPWRRTARFVSRRAHLGPGGVVLPAAGCRRIAGSSNPP